MSSIFPLLNNTFPFFISKYSSFVTVKYKTVFIMETHEEKKEEAAPAGPTQEELLAEIRDLLKAQQNAENAE